jgi:hypothetical protein
MHSKNYLQWLSDCGTALRTVRACNTVRIMHELQPQVLMRRQLVSPAQLPNLDGAFGLPYRVSAL